MVSKNVTGAFPTYSGIGSPIGVQTGNPGETYIDTSTTPATQWYKSSGTGKTSWTIVGPGGGLVLRKYTITATTSGLTVGVPLYTPKVGDVLYDAWFQITTAWNGTTPLGDLGLFLGSSTGILQEATTIANTGTSYLQDMTVAQVTTDIGLAYDGGTPNSLALAASWCARQLVPSIFATTQPLCAVVSQNGHAGGTATGATAGAADIYVLVGAAA